MATSALCCDRVLRMLGIRAASNPLYILHGSMDAMEPVTLFIVHCGGSFERGDIARYGNNPWHLGTWEDQKFYNISDLLRHVACTYRAAWPPDVDLFLAMACNVRDLIRHCAAEPSNCNAILKILMLVENGLAGRPFLCTKITAADFEWAYILRMLAARSDILPDGLPPRCVALCNTIYPPVLP